MALVVTCALAMTSLSITPVASAHENCIDGDCNTETLLPAAPEVRLNCDDTHPACANGKCQHVCAISSRDWPSSWVPIPYAPLRVEVVIPQLSRGPVTCVEFLLDGKLLLLKRVGEFELVGSQALLYIPCPAPGKHLLQARYLVGAIRPTDSNLWSSLSPPVRIDVRFPAAPKIIAIADGESLLVPLSKSGTFQIRKNSFWLGLAGVNVKDCISIYLDGELLDRVTLEDCCRCKVTIPEQRPPGIYALTARVTPGHSKPGWPAEDRFGPLECQAIHSQPSKQVMIRINPRPAFLWRADLASSTDGDKTERRAPEKAEAPAPTSCQAEGEDRPPTNEGHQVSSPVGHAQFVNHRQSKASGDNGKSSCDDLSCKRPNNTPRFVRGETAGDRPCDAFRAFRRRNA